MSSPCWEFLSRERSERRENSRAERSRYREGAHPSLFVSKLRLLLDDKSLVEKVQTLEEVERLTGGQLTEFRAVLRKNPLFDAIETFKQLMNLATLFSEQQTGASQGGKHSGRSKGRKSTGTHQPKDENQIILEQLDGLRTALTQSGSLEIVGEMLDTPPAISGPLD